MNFLTKLAEAFMIGSMFLGMFVILYETLKFTGVIPL